LLNEKQFWGFALSRDVSLRQCENSNLFSSSKWQDIGYTKTSDDIMSSLY